MADNKLSKIPKFYIIVGAMAIIVAFIMIFGGGREVFLDQKEISFNLDSYEEIVSEEDGTAETIILSTKDFKARISVDLVNISNYDDLVKALKGKNPQVKASISKEDEALLSEDEIIDGEKIIVNDKDFSVKE